MKATEIVQEIINGTFTQDEIASFYTAYKTKYDLHKQQANAIALSTIKVGAVGKITNIRPIKWNGVEVQVIKINKKKIEVKETNKEHAWPFSIPATCFIPN
jgi:hypothetical protein